MVRPSWLNAAFGGLAKGELQQAQAQAERQRLSDEKLIARTPSEGSPKDQMEMQRRLKVAITDLTGETIKAGRSASRAAGWLLKLTIVLVAFTAALVALTVVLAVRS